MENYKLDVDFNKYVFCRQKKFKRFLCYDYRRTSKILSDYRRDSENVPGQFTISAIQLGLIDDNTFGLINKYQKKIQINKIRREFVRTITVF